MANESPMVDRASAFGEPERVRCWLCDWPVTLGSSGTDRVQLYCMECGMQVVIHSAAGAKRLRDLVDRAKRPIEPRGAIAG